jgi:putative phosphoesterase
MTRVGIISDTHGQLRPAVLTHFAGVDAILHAGDIGDPDILTVLNAVAPVTAVFGNVDDFAMRSRVPEVAQLDLEGRRVHVVHGHQLGAPSPERLHAAHPDGDIVVFGHTHQPLVHWIGSRLFLNPGSAGPARFRLKPSVAMLELGTEARVEIIEL